jgi:NagD protein
MPADPKPAGLTVGGLILDLDGTLCRGEQVVPGAPEALNRLREMGVGWVFPSNTLDPPDVYAQRLQRFGIPASPGDIIQPVQVLRQYLRRELPGATLFAIAQPYLRQQLEPEFTFSEDPERIQVVIASYDPQFDYRKLTVAFRALRRGARFLATNVDATCPLPEGEYPDAAAVIGALEACSGRKLELNLGKPSPLMLQAALARLGLEKEAIILVGDRLETDIRMANEAGIQSVLVLTGVTRRGDVASSPWQPGAVLESLAALPELLGLAAR